MHKRKLIASAVLAGMYAGIPAANGAATLTTLVSFSSSSVDGGPDALAVGPSGNLIGTTANGGASGAGALFQLSSGSYNLTNLASFIAVNENDPYDDNGISNPIGPFVVGANGAIYGTANYAAYVPGTGLEDPVAYQYSAGTHTITRLTPANPPAAFGGVFPTGFISDSAGNLYGYYSGAFNYSSNTYYSSGVFKLNEGTGTASLFAVFSNLDEQAVGKLAISSGFVYGTLKDTSGATDGSVFKLNPSNGVVTTVAAFNENGSNGVVNSFSLTPQQGLIADPAGNLYGTALGGSGGYGVVLEIPAGSSTIETLASFNSSNGSYPTGLELDPAGDLFGITGSGGINGDGTVFEISAGTDTLSTLVNFAGSNGENPNSLLYSSGVLYGTTAQGTGSALDGTVFEVSSLSVPEPSSLSMLFASSAFLLKRRNIRHRIGC
jgi:uncharacterized repeat protein (TIGR03803 family)